MTGVVHRCRDVEAAYSFFRCPAEFVLLLLLLLLLLLRRLLYVLSGWRH